jgi:hypothetical protein
MTHNVRDTSTANMQWEWFPVEEFEAAFSPDSGQIQIPNSREVLLLADLQYTVDVLDQNLDRKGDDPTCIIEAFRSIVEVIDLSEASKNALLPMRASSSKQDLLTILVKGFDSHDILITGLVLEALSGLAFVEKWHKQFLLHHVLEQKLEELKKQYNHMSSGGTADYFQIAERVEALLSVIETSRAIQQMVRPRLLPPSQKKHVMLSYPWHVQEKVVIIRNALEQKGISTWMDIHEMRYETYIYHHSPNQYSRLPFLGEVS